MPYTGKLVEADFEKNTMTIEIDGPFIVRAGKYSLWYHGTENEQKQVCPNCKISHTEEDCGGYCTAACLQESN